MTDTLKSAVSPLQLRDQLETMVLKELLGPGSKRPPSLGVLVIFVGVLTPRNVAVLPSQPAFAHCPNTDDDEVGDE